MKTQRPFRSRPPLRSFTLLEIMVVLIIIAITATIVVPRLMYTRRRAFDQTVEQVADLMLVFAQRASLSSEPVGIFLDRNEQWMTLVTLESSEPGGGEDSKWVVDRLSQIVKLPEFITDADISATADGEPTDITQWPILSIPGSIRPRIEITLTDDEQDMSTTLVLSPYAVTPQISSRDDLGMLDERQPVDLDSTGHSREDW